MSEAHASNDKRSKTGARLPHVVEGAPLIIVQRYITGGSDDSGVRVVRTEIRGLAAPHKFGLKTGERVREQVDIAHDAVIPGAFDGEFVDGAKSLRVCVDRAAKARAAERRDFDVATHLRGAPLSVGTCDGTSDQ